MLHSFLYSSSFSELFFPQCVCIVRLLASLLCIFEISTVKIGVLSQFCYTCTCTCVKVAFNFISRFKDLKCLNKPDRAEVWGKIRALLQDMERERPAQPDNQVTPEPPTKKPTLMLVSQVQFYLSLSGTLYYSQLAY